MWATLSPAACWSCTGGAVLSGFPFPLPGSLPDQDSRKGPSPGATARVGMEDRPSLQNITRLGCGRMGSIWGRKELLVQGGSAAPGLGAEADGVEREGSISARPVEITASREAGNSRWESLTGRGSAGVSGGSRPHPVVPPHLPPAPLSLCLREQIRPEVPENYSPHRPPGDRQ